MNNKILKNHFFTEKELAIKTKNRKIGIKEIAERAKVSIGPVDRVLHNRGGVSKETHERIMKAIEELGYQPNILASRLKSNKEFTIAVIIPKGTREIPFWLQHDKGFEAVLQEVGQFGLNLELFHFHQNDESSFKDQIKKVMKEKFDGIFLVPVFLNPTAVLLDHCKKAGTPVIFFDSNIEGQSNLSFIGQNSKDSGYMAADLLHYTIPSSSPILIATISSKYDNHIHFSAREEGFRSYFEGTDRRIIKYENKKDNDKSIEKEFLEILKKEPDIQGIFVTNGIDRIAAIHAKHKLKNYRLIGYDLIEENIAFLQKGIINFLISQKPDKQAYDGIKLFYDHFIMKKPIEKYYYMPLDIVMKSNIIYYQ